MTDTNIYAAGSSNMTLTSAGNITTLSAPNGTVNIGSNDAGALTAGALTAGSLAAGPVNGGLTVDENSGYVGIGTSVPEYPLHIPILGEFKNQGGMDTRHINSTSNEYNNGTYSVQTSLYSAGQIVGQGYFAFSDKRIKTDISLVDDDTALKQVNALETYEYHYIDPGRRRSQKTIGFLAQDVAKIVPNAISIQTDCVPDEMRLIENPQWIENGDKYNLLFDLDISSNNTGKCRFYVSDDQNGNDEIMIETKINEDKTFTFDKKWNSVFLYGKEVNDFHNIDKNQIFTLHHSAIQELSRKHDAVVQENHELKERLAAIEAKLGM